MLCFGLITETMAQTAQFGSVQVSAKSNGAALTASGGIFNVYDMTIGTPVSLATDVNNFTGATEENDIFRVEAKKVLVASPSSYNLVGWQDNANETALSRDFTITTANTEIVALYSPITAQPLEDLTVTLTYGACDTLVPSSWSEFARVAGGLVVNNLRSDITPMAILTYIEDESNNLHAYGVDNFSRLSAEQTRRLVWNVYDASDMTLLCQAYSNLTVVYPPCGGTHTITDCDGNIYSTVRIGCECWMAENLKSTHYSNEFCNGAEIPVAKSYGNDDANGNTFGLLYSWYSAAGIPEGSTALPTFVDGLLQGACPMGWYLPTTEDYNNMYAIVNSARSLKSTNEADGRYWLGNSGTNASGFNVLPTGYYVGNTDRFYNLYGETYFWSYTYTGIIVNTSCPFISHTCPDMPFVDMAHGNGISIRCIRKEVSTPSTPGTMSVLSISAQATRFNRAEVVGFVVSNGISPVTERGICYSTTPEPTISGSHTNEGNNLGRFVSTLTGLTAETTYYVRAYATNAEGTVYGDELSFTTPEVGTETSLPTVVTMSIENVAADSAVVKGYVTSIGDSPVTERGICYSTNQNPTINDSYVAVGNGFGRYTAKLLGLIGETTYYVRAYATNAEGTVYGAEMNFTTPIAAFVCGTSKLKDIDGNVYNTVKIGQQCWMKENLRTTHYSDGTEIPYGKSDDYSAVIRNYPHKDTNNVKKYGYLYSWMAVMNGANSSNANPSGVQGICPENWHVPSDAEWTQLTTYVGAQSQYRCDDGVNNIAKALAAKTDWNKLLEGGLCAVGGGDLNQNNKTGFSALPAGYNSGNQTYSFGSEAYFWSSTDVVGGYADDAYCRFISHYYSYVERKSWNYGWASSVRCLRDSLIVTVSAQETGYNSAEVKGKVSPVGISDVTERGICYSTTPNPTVNDNHIQEGSGTGDFTVTLTGLSSATTYYVRAYAIDNDGTSYGMQKSFTTQNHPLPDVVTISAVVVSYNGAEVRGNVTYESQDSPIIERGVCYSTSPNPTIDNSRHVVTGNVGRFTATITGLSSGTIYYVRTYATINEGTAYGDEKSFTIPAPGGFLCGISTVQDYDNNEYQTILMGTQCWMKENLRTIHYSDGTLIPLASAASCEDPALQQLGAARFSPADDETLVGTYGYCYNWAAVMNNAASSITNPSGVQGVCPTGWHVPSAWEWNQLISFVTNEGVYACGEDGHAIGKAIASETGWRSSSSSCNNECYVSCHPENNNDTGFSLLPVSRYNGPSSNIGYRTTYSSATFNEGYNNVMVIDMSFVETYPLVGSDEKREAGLAVRCLRD